MQQILDLHIHSRFSRACSKDLTLSNLDKTCRVKGIDIIGTGDFTHPGWFNEIKNELEEISITKSSQPSLSSGEVLRGSGLYKLKEAKDDKIKFMLSAEVALIYKDMDRVRRIHLVIHAPNIKAAQELNDYLGQRYNIRSDGRPILGIKTFDFVKLCLSIHPEFLIYPAHIWTPWFSVFGSKSGFNSFEECFKDQTENIYAFETGLSSDPEMNWRVSALDHLSLLSNSDAHSLPNLGREATVLNLENASYQEIYNVIKYKKISRNNESGIKFTIEFYPEEGMYHFDGHRDCKVSFNPKETKKNKGICPVCKKPLVIGVAYRVDELADRPEGFVLEAVAGYKKIIELDKIIAEAISIKSRNSIGVKKEYNNLILNLGNEMDILMNLSLTEIRTVASDAVTEGIKRVREGNLIIKPGFDGQYGEVKIFNESERIRYKQQKLL